MRLGMRQSTVREVSALWPMSYELILLGLAAMFPLVSCALFVAFWKIASEDSSPDPIYSRSEALVPRRPAA